MICHLPCLNTFDLMLNTIMLAEKQWSCNGPFTFSIGTVAHLHNGGLNTAMLDCQRFVGGLPKFNSWNLKPSFSLGIYCQLGEIVEIHDYLGDSPKI